MAPRRPDKVMMAKEPEFLGQQCQLHSIVQTPQSNATSDKTTRQRQQTNTATPDCHQNSQRKRKQNETLQTQHQPRTQTTQTRNRCRTQTLPMIKATTKTIRKANPNANHVQIPMAKKPKIEMRANFDHRDRPERSTARSPQP